MDGKAGEGHDFRALTIAEDGLGVACGGVWWIGICGAGELDERARGRNEEA